MHSWRYITCGWMGVCNAFRKMPFSNRKNLHYSSTHFYGECFSGPQEASKTWGARHLKGIFDKLKVLTSGYILKQEGHCFITIAKSWGGADSEVYDVFGAKLPIFHNVYQFPPKQTMFKNILPIRDPFLENSRPQKPTHMGGTHLYL